MKRKFSAMSFLKKHLMKKPQVVLGIDIGTSAMKLAELDFSDGKPVLTQAVVAEFVPGADAEAGRGVEEYVETIHRVMQINGVRAKHAFVSVGGRSLFTREVSFPKMPPEELGEAVKWDIEKYVPYEEDCYYYDYAVLGETADGAEQRVMLVAALKETVDLYVEIFRRLSVRLLAVDGESFAAGRTVLEAKDFLYIDIGRENSQVLIYQDGIPMATRNIPVFGEDFAAAERSAAEPDGEEELRLLVRGLASEVERTIEYYRVQNRGAQFERVYITGGAARIPRLEILLREHIDFPLEVLNPAAHLKLDASLDAEHVRRIAPQMVVAVGLAMRGGEL